LITIWQENFHDYLSYLFRDLSNIFKNKSEKILSFTISLFKNFVDSEQNANINYNLKIYVNDYINTILKKRIYSRLNSNTAILELNRTIYKKHFDIDNNLSEKELDYIKNKLERSFSMSQFSNKSKLFDTFDIKIQKPNSSGILNKL
jgi:hypothetical protein